MLERSLTFMGSHVGKAKPSTRSNPLLPVETRGLFLSIDGNKLVDGIDLRLTAGKLTVILGQNGAGKSLLLRLLHGLSPPTGGEILFGGQPMDESIRRHQAMVFQRPVLLRRSVAANIDFVLNLRGDAGAGRRDALLAEVGLSDKAKQPARLLSGGEQQRLSLARALAHDPKILFMDEPTASLDPASVIMIERIVRAIQGRGAKVVFVTHDLHQARRLAGDILFMHRGRVAEHADAASFFDGPASEVAKAFLEGRVIA